MSDQESEKFISKKEEARSLHASHPETCFGVRVGENHAEFGRRIPPPADAPTLPSPLPASSEEEVALLKRCGFDAVLDNKEPKKVGVGQRELPSNGIVYEAGEEYPTMQGPKSKGRQKRSGNGDRERAPKTHDLAGFNGRWRGTLYRNGAPQKAKGKIK